MAHGSPTDRFCWKIKWRPRHKLWLSETTWIFFTHFTLCFCSLDWLEKSKNLNNSEHCQVLRITQNERNLILLCVFMLLFAREREKEDNKDTRANIKCKRTQQKKRKTHFLHFHWTLTRGDITSNIQGKRPREVGGKQESYRIKQHLTRFFLLFLFSSSRGEMSKLSSFFFLSLPTILLLIACCRGWNAPPHNTFSFFLLSKNFMLSYLLIQCGRCCGGWTCNRNWNFHCRLKRERGWKKLKNNAERGGSSHLIWKGNTI